MSCFVSPHTPTLELLNRLFASLYEERGFCSSHLQLLDNMFWPLF